MNDASFFLRRAILLLAAFALLLPAASLYAADPATAPSDGHGKTSDDSRWASPDAALAALKAGNERFLAGKPIEDYNNLQRVAATADQQHPIACVFACADSRTPPEAIFDLGIGDLFVCRVAGVTSGIYDVASLEYGTSVLGAPLIVVMGHKNCGAMKAAIAGKPLPGSLPYLMDQIRPAVDRARAANPNADPATLLAAATREQVMEEVWRLLAISPVIRKQVSDGKLKVVGAIYDISNGSVAWLGEHPEQSDLVPKVAH